MTDSENTLNMIQDFLSGPDAQEKINQALSMLGSGNFSFPDAEEKKEDAFSDINPEKLMRLMSTVKSLESQKDTRSDLIIALKPYLKKDKQQRAERAAKLVKLLKYTPLLEGLKDMF